MYSSIKWKERADETASHKSLHWYCHTLVSQVSRSVTIVSWHYVTNMFVPVFTTVMLSSDSDDWRCQICFHYCNAVIWLHSSRLSDTWCWNPQGLEMSDLSVSFLLLLELFTVLLFFLYPLVLAGPERPTFSGWSISSCNEYISKLLIFFL